jgi:hypothetical protein
VLDAGKYRPIGIRLDRLTCRSRNHEPLASCSIWCHCHSVGSFQPTSKGAAAIDKDTFVNEGPASGLKLLLTDAQNLVSLWGDAEVDESARPPEPGVDASEEELAAHQAYQARVEESQAGQRVRDQVTNYLGSAGECRYALASYFHAITPDDAAWQDTQLYADSTPTRAACLEGVWDHVVAGDASLAGELEGVGSDPEKQFVWITALKARSAELLQEAAATAAPEEGGQVCRRFRCTRILRPGGDGRLRSGDLECRLGDVPSLRERGLPVQPEPGSLRCPGHGGARRSA